MIEYSIVNLQFRLVRVRYRVLERKDVIGTHKGLEHAGAAFSRDYNEFIRFYISMVAIQIKRRFFFFTLFLLVISRPALAEEPYHYLTITGPCNLEFPEDHGAHPGYRTEWWYYTGNLHSASGDPYGFQLTFFRSQISPPGAAKAWPNPPSAWRTQQIYSAHAAVSDIAGKRHMQAELVSRGALEMAGVLHRPPETIIYNKNWSAHIDAEAQVLSVNTDEFSYELTLKPVKPPVLHGQAGYSLKGSSPQSASCYYSYTRHEVDGRLTIAGQTFAVNGQGWMDHEFSTAFLEPGIKGWDWFSVQLSDQTEIMLFLLRAEDGDISSVSGGTFVDPEGKTGTIGKDEFAVTILDTWKSPHSKAVYPSRWRLQIFPYFLDLTIFPNLADQEMQTVSPTGKEVCHSGG